MQPIEFCQVPAHLGAGQLCRWPDGEIPWTITALVPRISEFQLIEAVKWAFSKWAKTRRIKPIYQDTATGCRIFIGSRRIDGEHGILAECELPCSASQKYVRMWLDTSEDWITEFTPTDRQILLGAVIWHELGHAFGLPHAPDRSRNIMAPVYDPSITELGSWDLEQLHVRYPVEIIPPSPPVPPAPPVPPSPPIPGGPTVGIIDLILKLIPILTNPAFMQLLAALIELFAKGRSATVQDIHTAADKITAAADELRANPQHAVQALRQI